MALAILVYMAVQPAVAQTRELTSDEEKALQEQIGKMQYKESVKAVNDTFFTLEADRLTFRTGYTVDVTSSTNFITVDKGRASVQTAFNVPVSGANGMGGVTVDGTVSNYKVTTEERSGDTLVSMSVMGVGISATVRIRLEKDSNKASAEIMPDFNSDNLRMSGTLLPSDRSTVFKGRSL